MEFRVLGPLQVVDDAGATLPVSRQQGRLLAGLLIAANSAVSRDRLTDLLWADEPPPSARASLHAQVSRIRRALGAGGTGAPVLETGPAGYRLVVARGQVDAVRFEQAVSRARRRLTEDPGSAAEELDAALELWRGPAYAEFAEEPFAVGEATRLEELGLAALEHRAEARLRLGEHADVVAELERFVAQHPLREQACGHLILALYRCGRQAESLEVYRRLRERLGKELGLEPSADLRRLEQDVLRQSASLEWAGSGDLRHAVRGSLPVAVTSFLGRDAEVVELGEALREVRLLTLIGVGGVGKTRLALTAASSVAGTFDDGAWYCELAPLRAAESVPEALATALGAKEQPGESIEESLLSALRDRRMLVVLDNCEHVIGVAGHLAERITTHCPRVTVLATSRQRLAVDGERCWRVEPLPSRPTAEDGHRQATPPAVRLFRDRAVAVDAGFADADPETLTDICERLDGVPLAIELAAARVQSLGPRELSTRLDDRFRLLTGGPRTDPRHRTLAAVVDWSYALLSPAEQTVFARLSVFAGGFTPAGAEEVCAGDDVDPTEVVAILAELVDASLVARRWSASGVRLRVLETLRQYGAERLVERGEQAVLWHRFAEHFAALAEDAEPRIRGPDEEHGVGVLDLEMDNLRASHRYAVSSGDVDLALRLPASLHYYGHFRMRDEVAGWAEEALDLPGSPEHRLYPRVCATAAEGAGRRGDLQRAKHLVELGHRAARVHGVGDPTTVVPLLENQAVVALYEGRLDDCVGHAEAILARTVPAGMGYHSAFAHVHRALARTYAGDREAGAELAAQARQEAAATRNPTQRAWAAYVSGEVLSSEDVDAALDSFRQAIALADTVGNVFAAGVARVTISSLLGRRGDPRGALTSFSEVIGHWRRVNDWTHQWTTLRNLVDLFLRVDMVEAAAVVYGAADHARRGGVVFGAERDLLSATAAHLADRLGVAAYDAAVARGAGLGDDVVQFALDEIDLALTRPRIRGADRPSAIRSRRAASP